MSESRTSEGRVLNWRGPLLAATVFAGVFGILLLMAHQNQSNLSDEGSSLRNDPYGTSLMFDSFRRAGYQIELSQDEDSLADRNASRTTAFFIGGFPYDDMIVENGKVHAGKFLGRLENFLARGGRVVLVEPGPSLNSQKQGWNVEMQWNQPPRDSGPGWIAPDLHAMPEGSEKMYLSHNAPWLKPDLHWTSLYSGTASAIDENGFEPGAGDDSTVHVYMAMWQAGKGELVVASQESFLLNEAIKTHPNPVLLDFLTGGRPTIWVDETLHGLHQDEGVLWLVKRYRLQAALLLFWGTLLALLWSMSGDLVRHPARDWNAEIIRHGESPGVVGQRLLLRSVAADQVVAECWEQFCRRSPQDARAISADPRWSSRLRAALAQRPLAGYTELKQLINERRAARKGLAPVEREGSTTGPIR
jgi:hypothetical protein